MKIISLDKRGIELTLALPKFSTSSLLVVLSACLLSAIAYIITLKLNYVVAYNDARAHMNMARLVTDNLTPGLAQIGSVWLPLDHLLKLLLVWQNGLWQSGFAGALWSMVAYVGTIWVLYVFMRDALKSVSAALVGACIFALNMNVLYMQSTPMTELLLLLFFTAASYYLWKWAMQKKVLDLVFAAFFVFLATFTRYDGWFLYAYGAAMVLFVAFRQAYLKEQGTDTTRIKKGLAVAQGYVILFAILAGLGIGVWLLWNKAIFGQWLYFALGPYSAHAQQATIAQAGSLLTKGNIMLSLRAYWWAMVDNIGFLFIISGIIGLAAYAFAKKISDEALSTYSLLTPFFFHVISLVLGFSILVVPELGVSVTTKASASWFNVRYGLMIIPAVAFFNAYLARKSVILKIALVALVVIQGLSFYHTKNIITLVDGVFGTSSLDVADVRDWLLRNATDPQSKILTSISFNNALAFSTGFPLKRFIHEGTGKYWTEALENPESLAEYVVMANGDVGDPVYNALIKGEPTQFAHYYTLALKANHTNIYVRKKFPKDIVVRDGDGLYLNGKPFSFIGVNSYDLAYQTHDQIDQTLDYANKAGISIVRFWAFGENADGFQPAPGKINARRIDSLAYVIASAKKHNIKLIVTLANYWPEYGGVEKYLQWYTQKYKEQKDKDAFFTNINTRTWYRLYIETIVGSKNPYTNVAFKDDSSIMSWELMNEPRSSIKQNGSIVTTWANEMGKAIRTIDTTHLISLGSEGFIPAYNDGNNGPSIQESANVETNDLATAHFYLNGQKRDLPKIVGQWYAYGKQNGKRPLVLEEVGFDKRPQFNGGINREESLKNLLQLAKQNKVSGVVLWNWALWKDDNFGISPLDPGDTQLLNMISDYAKTLN